MDFRYIVENNEGYNEKNLSEKNLSEKNRLYLHGFRHAIDEIKTASENIIDKPNEDSLLGKMLKEIMENHIAEVVEWLQFEQYEIIVSLIENQDEDDLE